MDGVSNTIRNAFVNFFELFKRKDDPEVDVVDTRGEAIAMDFFRHQVISNRQSYGVRIPQAPGYDYLNWKAYGKHRIQGYNEDDFAQRAYRLSPYVQSVVESGCVGLEERRWAGLTGPPPPYVPGKSQYGSRLHSRTASREML